MAPANTQPFIGATTVKTVAGGLIKEALGAAMQRTADKLGVDPEQANRITEILGTEMSRDPVVVNSMNAERPIQSRILVGNAAAGAGILVNAGVMVLKALGYDIDESTAAYITQVIGAAITMWGVGYSVYGRLARGLKPLFARWTK